MFIDPIQAMSNIADISSLNKINGNKKVTNVIDDVNATQVAQNEGVQVPFKGSMSNVGVGSNRIKIKALDVEEISHPVLILFRCHILNNIKS